MLAVFVAPFAAPAGASSACGPVKVLGEWSEIAAPSFPSGPATISAYAVDPRRPNILWATNGASVMRSDDGGCTWDERFKLGILPSLDVPITAVNSVVDQIVISETPGQGDTVYLAVEESKVSASVSGAPVSATALRPHVVVSDDAGGSWRAIDDGLPPASGPMLRLRVAPSSPDTLYLMIAGPNGGLFASANGGTSWTQRGPVTGADLHVDPLDAQTLWFVGGGLAHSVDGGRTINVVQAVSNSAGLADVFHAPGAPARVMVHESEGPVTSMSSDGGATWTRFGSPIQVGLSMAHGKNTEDVLLSTHLGVWRFQSPTYWTEVTPGVVGGRRPKDYEPLRDLQVTRTGAPQAFGFRSDAILRYDEFDLSLPPIPSVTPGVEVGEVAFAPQHVKVRLGPGQEKKVRYRLELPPVPTPLDVFFLMDTSQSMDSSIRGLQFGIQEMASELARSRIDVQFGVGEFKDYPIAGFGDATEGDFPYRLNRAIGPADQSLIDAITMMRASGGGRTHIPESQLTALYQAVTGEGEPGFVEPGQEAGFRPGALKVIIHITDAPFDNSSAHPSPPADRVAAVLRDNGVLQVGLAVYGKNGVDAARKSLQDMATATETLVPPGGVDCGNYLQLPEGAPLVCDVTEEDERGAAVIAPAVLAVLRSLVEESKVQLFVESGAGAIAAISPEVYPAINVKDPQTVPFEVTFACPVLPLPSRTEVELAPLVDEAIAARATATVICDPTEVKPKVIVPVPPPPPVEVAPALVPPPAPPAPPAPVTQAQPNPNPQGAMAQQEQQQPQVALATEGLTNVEEEELAFVAYERRGAPAGTILYLSAAVLTTAFSALALRTRRAAESVRTTRNR